MAEVKTNNISLAYNIEASLGDASEEWFLLEPNTINAFGVDTTTTARDPITRNRQNRKGSVTDLNSTVGYAHDFTISVFRDFIEGYCFAIGINRDVTQLTSTGATGNTFTGLEALDTTQIVKFPVDSLLWVTGGNIASNNGLKTISTAASDSDTTLTVSETLTDETTDLRVSFAGFRISASESPTWVWEATSKIATLNTTGIKDELEALGLTPGQLVHIGSIPSLGGEVQNAFENTSANDVFGFARLISFPSDDSVAFDKTGEALQFSVNTAPTTPIDICFGEFIRNVPVGDDDSIERSFQFEASFPNLGDSGEEEYQYALGNLCSTVSFNLPLTGNATVTFGFVGTDTSSTTQTRKTGADIPISPTQTSALSTSADLARLRITTIDEEGLSTDFKTLTLTLDNNVTPEKFLGKLGARFINTGNFSVNVSSQLAFTSGRVIDAIRNNTTVNMDFILNNDDGVVGIDLPSMTLNGGGREYPRNETVLINVGGDAFEDPRLQTSIGVSIFPIPFKTNELC